MITHMLLSWFQVVVHFSYNYFLFIELYSAHVICAVAMFFVLPILYFTALSLEDNLCTAGPTHYGVLFVFYFNVMQMTYQLIRTSNGYDCI